MNINQVRSKLADAQASLESASQIFETVQHDRRVEQTENHRREQVLRNKISILESENGRYDNMIQSLKSYKGSLNQFVKEFEKPIQEETES